MQTLGILGGGQLGQMLSLTAHSLGLTPTCFDEHESSPASFVTHTLHTSLSDMSTIQEWARGVDVLTYEFENFPAEFVGALSETRPVVPNVRSLAVAQDRGYEKQLFVDIDIPVPTFRVLEHEETLHSAIYDVGFPVVVKTRSGGYDGKGQLVVRAEEDIPAAADLLAHCVERTGQPHVIVEQLIAFDKELSVIGVRDRDGELRTYPLPENVHHDGILHTSTVLGDEDDEVTRAARTALRALMEELDYVGVLALELFAKDGRIYANEFAPRVHNSGHWTIEGATTSQFENHVRAAMGLPLGSTELLCPTAMINVVGTWPDVHNVLKVPGTHVHDYRKTPRQGRKLGHITITAPTPDELLLRKEQVLQLFSQF